MDIIDNFFLRFDLQHIFTQGVMITFTGGVLVWAFSSVVKSIKKKHLEIINPITLMRSLLERLYQMRLKVCYGTLRYLYSKIHKKLWDWNNKQPNDKDELNKYSLIITYDTNTDSKNLYMDAFHTHYFGISRDFSEQYRLWATSIFNKKIKSKHREKKKSEQWKEDLKKMSSEELADIIDSD